MEGLADIGMKACGCQPMYSHILKAGKRVCVDYSGLINNEVIKRVYDNGGKPVSFQVRAWDENTPGDPYKNPLYKVEVFKITRGGTDDYLFWAPKALDILYTDDRVHRFTQEVVFGKAVYKFFQRMNMVPDILHLNEAHTVVAATLIRADDVYFDKTALVYTNHTIVPAGLEMFCASHLGTDVDRMMYVVGTPGERHLEARSKFLSSDGFVDFCSAAVGLEDVVINGVSDEHAVATKYLFEGMLDHDSGDQVIGILNGSGKSWKSDSLRNAEEKGLLDDPQRLWSIHEESKTISYSEIERRTGISLDANKPALWAVRRLVDYKSQYPILQFLVHLLCADRDETFTRESLKTLWLRDIHPEPGRYYNAEEVLGYLFKNRQVINGLGMQVVIGGPEYMPFWVEEFKRWTKMPEFSGRFVYIPNSDAKMLKLQAIGADLCVNMPRPLEEACGTSDQRTGLNGGVNIALNGAGPAEWIVDYDKKTRSGCGFLIDSYTEKDKSDKTVADGKLFYDKAPADIFRKAEIASGMFYDDKNQWKKLMLDSYRAANLRVTAEAMEQRYALKVYGKAIEKRAKTLKREKADPLALLLDLKAQAVKYLYFDHKLDDWAIITGSPHFDQRNPDVGLSNWGRDTMVSLPGISLVTGRPLHARAVLAAYFKFVRDGLLPNLVGDGQDPCYNSVDAGLWLFWAVGQYLRSTGDYEFLKADIERKYSAGNNTVYQILEEIIRAHINGIKTAHMWENPEKGATYFRPIDIHMDKADCLLYSGNKNTQLTWMDAQVDDLPVTSRHGKAVEINALWYNALVVMDDIVNRGADKNTEYRILAERVKENFVKFWNADEKCLFDTIDGSKEQAEKVRPNQIIAVSFGLLDNDKSIRVVEKVKSELFTPCGLRSLSYKDEGYKFIHIDNSSYHQGTVWPWLMGFFIQSHIAVYGRAKTVEFLDKSKYFEFLAYLFKYVQSFPEIFNGRMEGEIKGLAEISDERCESIFAWNELGCKAQAWSVAENLRGLALLFPGEEDKDVSDPGKTKIIYEMVLRDYCDPINNTCGLVNAQEELAYLAECGIDYIYLLGLMEHTGSPFEIINPRNIDKRAGSFAELDSFIKGAKAAGIRTVLIDQLANQHIAKSSYLCAEHPERFLYTNVTDGNYFKEERTALIRGSSLTREELHRRITAGKGLAEALHNSRMDVSGELEFEGRKIEINPADARLRAMVGYPEAKEFVIPPDEGLFLVSATDEVPLKYFPRRWRSLAQPDLSDPAVIDSGIETGFFWLNKNIGGFRVDAALSVFPDKLKENWGIETENNSERSFIDRIRLGRAGSFILFEGFERHPELLGMADFRFCGAYNWKPRNYASEGLVNRVKLSGLIEYLKELEVQPREMRENLVNLGPEHDAFDFGDLWARLDNNDKRLLYFMYAFMPGYMLVFNGQLIGKNHKYKGDYSQSMPVPRLCDASASDRESGKRLFSLRKNNPLLISGEYMVLSGQSSDILAIARFDKEKSVIGIINPINEDKVAVVALKPLLRLQGVPGARDAQYTLRFYSLSGNTEDLICGNPGSGNSGELLKEGLKLGIKAKSAGLFVISIDKTPGIRKNDGGGTDRSADSALVGLREDDPRIRRIYQRKQIHAREVFWIVFSFVVMGMIFYFTIGMNFSLFIIDGAPQVAFKEGAGWEYALATLLFWQFLTYTRSIITDEILWNGNAVNKWKVRDIDWPKLADFFRDGIKGTFLFMGIDLGGSALLIYLFGLDNVSAFLIARGLVSTPIGIIWSQHIRKKQGYGREAQRNEAIKSFVFDLISVTVTYLGGGSNLGGLIIVYQLLRKIIGQAWSVIADLWYPKIVIKRDLTQDIYFLIPYNRKKFRSSGVTLKFGDEAERFGKDMVKASYYLQEKLKRGFGIRRLKSDDIDEMLNKAGVLLLNNGNWDTTNISDIIRLKTLLLEQLGAVEINTISEDNVREIIEPVRLQDAPREIVSFINCNLSLHNSIVNESKQYYRKLLAFSLLYAGKDSIDSQVWQKRLQAGQVKKEKILIWAVDRSILPGGIVSGLNGINVIVDRLAGGMIILTSAKDDPKTVFDLYCESLMGVQRLLYNSQVIGRLAGGDSPENFGADLIKHIESCHKPVSIDFYGWSTGEILEGIFARQVLKFITERLSRNPDSPKDLSALFNEFGTSPLLIDRIGLPLRKLCRLQFTEDVIKKADLLISAEKLIGRNIMNMHGELWGALFDWDQNEAFNNKEEMNHNRFMPPQSKPCLFVPKRSGIADGGFKEIENTEGINTVGIVSDTHDDKGSLSLAVRFFNENKVDLVLHAGDFTAAAMVVELNGLICQWRGVLGNSDTQQSAKLLSAAEENIWLGPGPLKILLSGKEICLIHDIKELNENDRQDSDVIISGHTHTAWMEESGGKLLINPGSDNWMHSGCFNSDPTVAILDLGSLKVDVYEISSKGKVSKKQMYSFGDDDYGFARAGTVTNGKPAGEAVIVALSLGGSKLGAGVLNLKGDFLFVADSLNLHEILGVKPKEAMPQNIVALIDRQIKNVVASSGIDPANIEKAGIAFAGPVNTRSGIIGTPFAAPNLPFDHFALQDVLQGMLRSDYGRDIPVVIENDCIAALRGELSPKGALHKIGTGTVFIIGTGINGAVAKDGKSYPGLQGEIMELGHNIVLTEKLPAAYTRSNGRYTYTGFVTKGDHPRDENGNIVKGDFEDRLSGPNLDARFVQEGFSLVGITDDALKGSAAAAELIESCGREIGQAVAAFIHAYIKEDFVRDIILISSVSENLGKGLKDSQGNDVFISAVQKGAGDELMKLGVGEQDAWGIVGGIMRSKMDYRRELVGFVNAGPVTEKEPGDPKNDFDELKNALAGLGDALDGGDLNKQGKGAVMYGRIIRGRCRGESFEVFSAGFARRMENNLNAALGILKTHKVREFVYCQGAAKSLDFMVSDDESSVFFDCSPGGLLRLPVSAFGNLNMLAFMLRHKLNCNRCIVDKNGNNDDFLRREAIRNDMKFFLRLNGRQRKDILLGLKRFPYPAEATLSDISQAVDNIDMSGLFRDIYGQDIHRFCQDEQRLVRDTKKIISFFESSSITDGRIIGFILGLVYINRMKSRVGISLRAYELQDLLTG
ncbi:MAG: YfcE family phosphodiesterase, partial [Candidatus Omnitrophica bacterium]|nr:YfcE family phosphodiesterase [Candidatus Omnitrophota bacterium]